MLAASPFTFAVYTKERTRIRGKIEKLFRDGYSQSKSNNFGMHIAAMKWNVLQV
jgi:hypothetical protein